MEKQDKVEELTKIRELVVSQLAKIDAEIAMLGKLEAKSAGV